MKHFITILLLLLAGIGRGQIINIGIIADFEPNQARLADFQSQLKDQVQKTLGSSFTVAISNRHVVGIGWDAARASEAYDSLTASCDYIVLVGALSTRSILQSNTLTKPTLAIGFTNLAIQEIPYTAQGTSGVNNFSYVLTSRDVQEELAQFRALVPYKKLAILVHEKNQLTTNKEKADEQLSNAAQAFNCEIYPVFLGNDLTTSLKAITPGTDAVVIAATYELGQGQVQEISNYLINNRLPSWSVMKQHVSTGILASQAPDNGIEYLIRKLAIMVDDIRQGAAPASLPVNLDTKRQLYFNVGTARQIGYSPSFQTLFTANLVNEEYNQGVVSYNLGSIMEQSLAQNLDIKVSQQDIALAVQEVREAKSNFLPTAEIALSQVQLNEGQTNELFGASETTLTETGTVDQLLFAEEAAANIRIQQHLLEAQQHNTQQQINDVILNTYLAYFNVLLIKSNIRVQKENLEVNKKNLELAQVQNKIGAAGISDVYRWQAEVATSVQAVIEAQTDLILAKRELNVVLNNTLEDEFDVEDIAIEDELFQFFEQNIMAKDINGPEDIDGAAAFLTAEALVRFPSRQALKANIAATERQYKMNKRAYYTPALSLGFQQDEVLNRSGNASVETPTSNFFNSTWSLALVASYPIFDGNRRSINLQKTKVQQNQLGMQLRQLDNNIAFSVQTAAIELVTSRTNIHFSGISADNSWKNFELTQDYYRKGAVSIVQLFDAQNAAIQAKLAYINSVYEFLIAFVNMENSIGYYSMLATPEQQAAFEQRYQSFKATQQN